MGKYSLLLIANLYPSKSDLTFGIFVKKFNNALLDSKIKVKSKIIIYGRGRNSIEKILKYVNFYISILFNILKFNYDIIYIHYPIYSILPTLLLLPIIKKPIVLNFHGSDVFTTSKLSSILQILTLPLIKKATTIVVPSIYFKNIIIVKFNVPENKVFISPSGGVDMHAFNKIDGQKDENYFTIGYVGRIDKGKGWNTLLKSVNDLKTRIPKLRCLIAGSGAQVKDMNEMIKEHKLEKIVSHVGAIPHNELNRFYNRLDLFAFPTGLSESLGLVGVEALACCVPVVGSKIGGLEEYIIDGENGYLFEPNNDKQLAEKIYYIYNHNDILLHLKTKARKSVKKFDQNIVAQEMSLKLQEIVNNQ